MDSLATVGAQCKSVEAAHSAESVEGGQIGEHVEQVVGVRRILNEIDEWNCC